MKPTTFARRAVFAATAAILALLVTAIAPRAYAQKRVTLQQLMTFAFPDEITAAAQGERIAWVFNIKGVRNVWVADGPAFSDARAVTHYDEDDGRPIASLRLTPDGRTVVYARGSELNQQGQVADPNNLVTKPEQQVWAVDVDSGGEPRLLGTLNCQGEGCEDIEISPDGRRAAWAARGQIWVAPISGGYPAQSIGYVRGENSQPRWSPDSQEIAFQSNRSDHGFIVIYDFASRTLRYMHPAFDRDILPRWSPDGRQIAFVRLPGVENKQPIIPVRPVPWSIWVGNPHTGEAHRIYQSGNTMNDSYDRMRENESFAFVAGDRVLFAGEMDGWNHLYAISAKGGEPVRLTTGQYEVKDVTIAPNLESVLYSSNENDVDRRHIWRVSVSGGAPQALTEGATIEWFPVETGDGKYDLCLGSSATTPAMPYLIKTPGRQIIAGQLIANYPSSELVTPKQVIFKSLDGLEIHGQLFVPRGHIEHAPALVYMHGGPVRQMMLGFHYMDYYHYAYAENQYLVSLGFVVFSVNYRTGIMYGRAFREPANAGWRGASEYQDIVAGAKYLQSLPYVDPQRIGLWGGSYGGYLTALGLARNSDIFKAGVDMHGVHDWSVFLSHWFGLIGQGQHGAPPDIAQAMKLAWDSSPDASIAMWKSPVLVIQGDDDRNVPFNQSVDLVERLRQHHVPFETLVFPDEIHGFLMWKSWMRAYTATADFFVRVLVKGEKISTDN
jgi:dipeptidyl aminopeptidase/acylaminoacyl peptidase